MDNYINNNSKEIFDLQERHAMESHTPLSSKNFFFNQIVNIFMFTSSIISIIMITLVIYLFCNHEHIRTITARLMLHKTKEIEANSNPNSETNNYECGTLAYVGIILTILRMITVIFLHHRNQNYVEDIGFQML